VWVPAGVPPSGVVTFLFTDIEGSTRRWESDPDSMQVALAAHDKVLRTAFESNGGFVFSHTGDGMAAAFASPMSAVDAAIDAQRELQLPVRMGIATGEAELRDDDYFGTVLNRAARLMAAGHGGQILLADSTAVLLSGVDLVNLGPRRLRDVPIPLTVFQLRAPELRTDFPPLRTVDASPGNLRPAVTGLVGRDGEVAEIVEALRSRRLVTLTGVGGVGKTRLAMAVAAQLAPEFLDGVWVFELAAVTDPAAVPDAVATVLGITQQPGKSVTESVASALEGRNRLLVLDNCEHLVDAAADLIEAILGQSSTVSILTTSREGLDVVDEQLWPVRGLDADAAVRLFVQRARNVSPGFSADQPNVIDEICRRLDRIPLAVELAASRMSSMTADDIRDRLDRRFKLLVGSRRGLERHQTLRHAVQWSYDLLDDAEKMFLDRCSVFAGGFTLESACAVAGSDDIDDFAVLDLLDALVRKSLLGADRSSGHTRFSMLETIRQFAEDQLVVRGEADEDRAAHARHFAEQEGEIMALWDSPRQRESNTWFIAELGNLRTAFRWAADNDHLTEAAAIAVYATALGNLGGQYEPIGWTEELVEPARAVDHPRLLELYEMASHCWLVGKFEAAVGYGEAGQTVFGNGRDYVAPLDVAYTLGTPYLYVGQPQRAVEWYRALLDDGLDNPSVTRAALVMALSFAGSADEAVAAAEGLADAAEATRNPYLLSFALLAEGFAFRDSDPHRALNGVRRGMVIAEDSGNHFNVAHLALLGTGLEAAVGDLVVALDYAVVAIGSLHDSGNPMYVPLAMLAAVFDRLGRFESAAIVAGFALTPFTAGVSELTTAIAHLREVLGDQTYESLARKGATMTTAEMVAYAYDQIDQARTELEELR
jgi:predicted ATPase/class 3 adenylate cyclase